MANRSSVSLQTSRRRLKSSLETNRHHAASRREPVRGFALVTQGCADNARYIGDRDLGHQHSGGSNTSPHHRLQNLSTMEAFGLVVGILQVSVYASNFVSAIKDIRQAIRNGPILLQEKTQQLHILSVAVDNIGLSPQLHSKDIEASLSDVERLILRLQKIIRRRLLRPTDTSVRKLRVVISCIGGDKEVEQTFVALQGHCHFLGFYLQTMPTGSDKKVTEQLQSPAHTSAHDRGHILDPSVSRRNRLCAHTTTNEPIRPKESMSFRWFIAHQARNPASCKKHQHRYRRFQPRGLLV